MSNGTSGDANCCDFDHAQRKFDSVSVAEDVSRAAYRSLPADPIPGLGAARHAAEAARTERADARSGGSGQGQGVYRRQSGERKPQTWAEVYAREIVLLDRLPATRELKLQAIRLGDFGIAAIPCEVYGRTGLKIKQSSPLKPTMNISLANGCEGYLPPPDQFPLGGYTTWRARTSCLEMQAEPKIVATVLDLLTQVAAKREL